MYQRVKAYIQRYGMLKEKDRVIVGVSGGADSICLLFMLIDLKNEMEIDLTVVHVHHGIRGAEAERDLEYVERVCREQGIRLRVFREDVPGYAKEKRMTLEEAGREVRRQCFLEVMEAEGGSRIALAHHQNDNAETLIWNLCRGCGMKGLGGIPPADGAYIRPLLCLNRSEIESYLEKRGISYYTDETNLDEAYTRNRIRGRVIPYLEQEINSQTVLHMAETAEQMRNLSAYIQREMDRYGKACIRIMEEGGAVLEAEHFRDVPEELKAGVLHELLCQVAGKRKDIESVHVRLVAELLDRQVGRELHLPYGMTARRCYEGIEISRKKEVSDSGSQRPEVKWRVLERTEERGIFPDTPYTKWFDYDIIKNTVKMRRREPGDYIVIDKDGRTQKLKQYFINEKIPKEQRDQIWLLADESEILWIVGLRQSQKYQVSDQTKRILEIEFCGGKKDGREYQSIVE